MMMVMGLERLVRGWKDKRWWRCWDEKVVGMYEASYASLYVGMLVQMSLLCVGVGLTPAHVYVRDPLLPSEQLRYVKLVNATEDR